MSTGHKKKHVKFTFKSFIRVVVFGFIIFLIISYISGQKLNSPKISDPTLYLGEEQSDFVLGKTTEIGNEIYQSIPEKSRNQLENLNQNPIVIYIQEKIDFIKNETQGFPQKQIKEIQKKIVQGIYENTLKSIESQ